MRKNLLFVSILILTISDSLAQTTPKRELRGAWIATYANIDWPNKAQTVNQQKNALLVILDDLVSAGTNTFFIQVRSQCDAMYYSTIEPWSADLTGTQGQAPNPLWDPMAFAIEECHKRGVEFHAWLNPYRAIGNFNSIQAFSPNHVARQHPEWLLSSGNLRTLDPGLPQVRNYILAVVKDIATRYDVDGIHFDDYFYPSGGFDDSQTYSNHSRGFTNISDWRRDNVDLMIQSVYEGVKLIKPWVKFGVSPSGIYRNSTNPAIGTQTSGLEHYSALYADSKKWIQQGWVDYLAPQVYWYIGQSGADYSKIIPWWNDQASGRHIYIGLAGYKVNDPAQNASWANPSQIPNQIRLNRNNLYPNIKGQAVYNTTSIRSSNTLGFKDSLKNNLYKTLSLQPLMPWRDDTAPVAPTSLQGDKFGTDSLVLNWTIASGITNELDKVRKFVIYRSANAIINQNDPANIIGIIPATQTRFADKDVNTGTNFYYEVTALDRLNNESAATNTISTLTTSIPIGQQVSDKIIAVYPNPTTKEITVRFPNTYKSNETNVFILDLNGRKVYEKLLLTKRQFEFVLNFNLQPGLYILYTEGEGFTENFKIIVQ